MASVKVDPIIITFGGGLSTRKRPNDIDINECTEGTNFDLDPQVMAMQKRSAFDLVDTAPNAAEIRGYAQNIRQDGTITTLIQAGGNIYQWDHAGTFTLVGTTPSSARLRGPREHNFTLDQYTIITDLNQQDVVKKWDGFTLTTLPHNLIGTFQARYCRVANERAFYGNVKNASTDLPHILVGSRLGDADVLSVNDRPASTLNQNDPFFIPTKDLKPINGFTEAFGLFVLSTKRGRLYELAGSSAFDFELLALYDGSSVSGDESIVNIGNDVALGLPARIESLSGTEKFGDVASDDLSIDIANLVQNTESWSLAYDRKRRMLYCFPDNQSAVYVYNKRVVDFAMAGKGPQISPWTKWTTGLSVNLQPTCVMPLIHTSTFEEVVYFGDSAGHIYQFYGTGGKDGGTETFSASRTSKLFRGIPDGKVFDIKGMISYRKQFAAVVTLTFHFAGDNVFDKSLRIDLPAGDGIAVYNGTGANAAYYNSNSAFYGRSFSERVTRQKFGPPGLEGWFQVKLDVASEGDVDIQELAIEFATAA